MTDIVLKAISLIETFYFDETNIERLKGAMVRMIRRGLFDDKKDYEIANLMYDVISRILHDKHITFEANMQYRRSLTQHVISEIYQVVVIDDNIGLVKFDEFIDFGLNKIHAQKSFHELSATRRNMIFTALHETFQKIREFPYIIFDLTANTGGCEQIVKLMISYMLRRRTILNRLYYRDHVRTITTYSNRELRTMSGCDEIPTLYDNNIIVLVSKNTFSAGEEFAYDLQALKRATIIGERTGGGANGGDYFRINEHMKIFIPFYEVINNITGSNWNNIGVKPDIRSSSERAMNTAINYIKRCTRRKISSGVI